MCGIAGEFIVEPGGIVDVSLILPIASALHHRGPDEWGFRLCARERGDSGASAFLLSTRLAIVDLAHGRQPLSNEDGTIWVALNGEIYGFADLARSLERRGHRFRTRTDTEVIVHLYEEFGEDFVTHLRGEFAIALLDERKRVLYLVRDRFGIKPLFYAELTGQGQPRSIAFASEIKALFQFPRLARTLNRRHLFHTLHGLVAPGETYFEGVHDLEPGCMLRVTRDGVRKRRYWDLPFVSDSPGANGHDVSDPGLSGDARNHTERAVIEEYGHRLRDAVRLRLHGDVEAGVFLSGGVDSATIASMMTDYVDRPLKAFTIAFGNPAFDESASAADFVHNFNGTTAGVADRDRANRIEHHVVRIDPGALAPAFERSMWHGEIVVANSHGVAKLLLSELAHRHVKVVLTGEGADESLAGYNVFRHLILLEALRRDPDDGKARGDLKDLLASLGMYSGILPIREYPDYERISRLFGAYPYAMARALRLARAARRILSREFRADMSGVNPIDDMAQCLGPGRLTGLDAVSSHQYYGFKADLAGYILVCLGDRAEMANSLEGRLPFLDHKVVEYACTLPVHLKVRQDTTKYLLRQVMKARAPAAAARRKHPFMAPSAETLGLGRGSDLTRYLDRATIKKVGLFDPLAVGALRQALKFLPARSYAHSLAETLLTLVLSTHVLHEQFIERFDETAARFNVAAPSDEQASIEHSSVG